MGKEGESETKTGHKRPVMFDARVELDALGRSRRPLQEVKEVSWIHERRRMHERRDATEK